MASDEQQITDPYELLTALFGDPDTHQPAESWVETSVELRNRNGSIVATIPSEFIEFVENAEGVDFDRDDPPEVPSRYDPRTHQVLFDLTKFFDHE